MSSGNLINPKEFSTPTFKETWGPVTIFDNVRDKVIFAFYGINLEYNQVFYEFDPYTYEFKQMTFSNGGPKQRVNTRGIFDESKDRIIYIGGCWPTNCSWIEAFNQVWGLYLNVEPPRWELLQTFDQSKAMGAHSMAIRQSDGLIASVGGHQNVDGELVFQKLLTFQIINNN